MIKSFATVLFGALCFLNLVNPAFAADEKGTFFRRINADPTTLNPITSADAYASEVQGMVLDSLMIRDDETYDWRPALAEKYEVSKDGKVFKFTIRDGVKWHDGKPLTIEDVKYSFDVFFEGRFQAPHMQVYLQNIKEAKILDSKTIQFTIKEPYFKNFEVVAGLTIIPKHFYGTGDPADSKFNKELIGTGPYRLEGWNKGQKITLTKNAEYWGNSQPYFKERFRFKRIVMRPVKEDAVALEMLKKGELDLLDLTPEQYVQKTKGSEWGTKVIAVKAENAAPSNFSYGYIGWNQKNPLFKDRDVRMAMSHLINRDFMIEKFRFGMSLKAVGPYGNKSPSSSPKVKPVEYDPKAALELLKKNGWKMGAGGLTKVIDGKETPFEFTLIGANADNEKYWTVIKEDMKKIGITMNIKILEWNSFIKLVDERKFDAITMGWQVNSLESDLKQMFDSEEIKSPGHNFISYNSPELDKLIEQHRKTMDEGKRMKIAHQIHEIIAADQPYSFMFNSKFTLYAHTARIKKTKDTFKYAVGVDTWKVEQE